jgi:hypothetical protein
MYRTVHIFVGDKVRTPDGIGIVEDINTWREKIVEMNNEQAVEFCDQCSRAVGLDYKETWAEVFVTIGGIRRQYLPRDIEILEGRDQYDKKGQIGS